MFIRSLSIHDKSRAWQLEEISFKPLTLLVGGSGVGKTQILDSILKIRDISKGKSFNGLEWRAEFETDRDQRYVWEGEFDSRPMEIDELLLDDRPVMREEEETNPPTIVRERLWLNEKQIVDRNDKAIRFLGNETVKLPREKSVIHLLSEPAISRVYNGLQRILSHEGYPLSFVFRLSSLLLRADRFQGIEDICDFGEDFRLKLYLATLKAPDVLNRIKDAYIEVFPFVEDIKIAPVQDEQTGPLRGVLHASIREKGVDGWINELMLSSGMSHTLWHLAELHLCAQGTVILVDEFENSLGVNCIDAVTDLLLSPERDLQFIVTSHHPYIINNIPSSCWKVVTRDRGVVRTLDADQLNMPRSKHDAFMRLINTDAYRQGPAS